MRYAPERRSPDSKSRRALHSCKPGITVIILPRITSEGLVPMPKRPAAWHKISDRAPPAAERRRVLAAPPEPRFESAEDRTAVTSPTMKHMSASEILPPKKAQNEPQASPPPKCVKREGFDIRALPSSSSTSSSAAPPSARRSTREQSSRSERSLFAPYMRFNCVMVTPQARTDICTWEGSAATSAPHSEYAAHMRAAKLSESPTEAPADTSAAQRFSERFATLSANSRPNLSLTSPPRVRPCR